MSRPAWMRVFVMVLSGLVMASPAWATIMPTLTPFPQHRDFKACQGWAAQQDEDTTDMWGTQASGQSDKDVALARLTLNCTGDEQPQIVGFYSSAGAADLFCRTHKGTLICKQKR